MSNIKSIATGLCLSLAAMAMTATTALSMPMTVPTILNPGDQYRLAFITSTTRDATSALISDYNDFVTTAANTQTALTALGTTWTAIVSTATVDARDNTGTLQTSAGGDNGVPIFLLNDTQLVSGYDSLWDNSLDTALRYTEAGLSRSDPLGLAWTGTSSFPGTVFTNFGLGSPGGNAETGLYVNDNFTWANSIGKSTTDLFPLYAISGVLSVPTPSTTIPEPGTLALFGLGLAGLGFARRRKQAA